MITHALGDTMTQVSSQPPGPGDGPGAWESEPIQRLIEARHHDPFEVLGRNRVGSDPIYRAFYPNARRIHLVEPDATLEPLGDNGVFELRGARAEVHGKGSMLGKMAGDRWQRFANLRLLYAYQWTYPGKKLLFMGSEFGQEREWNATERLDWELLERPHHAGVQALVADLNAVYRERRSLHAREFDGSGFEWIDCHDAAQSVLSYLRHDRDELTIVLLNFTPVVRHEYRIGMPRAGRYRERVNTDSRYYGGGDVGHAAGADSEPMPWMGHPHSIALTLPPLAALILVPD
jgi:1,4-alpha-glucan branching enzyme